MKRNDYRLDVKQTLEAVRANRGTPAYQAMLEYLDAEIELLKDQIDNVHDDHVISAAHVINYLKRIVAEIKNEPRKKPDDPRRTGAYTD